MSRKNFIATAQIKIDASLDTIWDALMNPDIIKQYMLGTTVTSDWKEGSKIIWKGEWTGKPYQDKGEILEMSPKEKLAYSHYSPLTGEPDVPENYHTFTIKLENVGKHVEVTLTQDNNPSEEARKHSEKNWTAMLREMKKTLERNDPEVR